MRQHIRRGRQTPNFLLSTDVSLITHHPNLSTRGQPQAKNWQPGGVPDGVLAFSRSLEPTHLSSSLPALTAAIVGLALGSSNRRTFVPGEFVVSTPLPGRVFSTGFCQVPPSWPALAYVLLVFGLCARSPIRQRESGTCTIHRISFPATQGSPGERPQRRQSTFQPFLPGTLTLFAFLCSSENCMQVDRGFILALHPPLSRWMALMHMRKSLNNQESLHVWWPCGTRS